MKLNIKKPDRKAYCVFIEDGKVLVARKKESKNTGFYEIPGGKLTEKEDILVGLNREIKEETGLEFLNSSFFRFVNCYPQFDKDILINNLNGKIISNNKIDCYKYIFAMKDCWGFNHVLNPEKEKRYDWELRPLKDLYLLRFGTDILNGIEAALNIKKFYDLS